MIQNPEVAAVFEQYPANIRARLLVVRQLILDTAAEMPEVGAIEETLKWGQPSYLTPVSKSGTTIRIDGVNARQYGLYVHCQTTLIEAFRHIFPDEFTYDGNRCLLLDTAEELPVDALKICIAMTLTYHLDKNLKGERL